MLKEKIDLQAAGNLLTLMLLVLIVFEVVILDRIEKPSTSAELLESGKRYHAVVLGAAGLCLLLTRTRLGAWGGGGIQKFSRFMMWPIAIAFLYFAGVNFMGSDAVSMAVIAPASIFMSLLALRLTAGEGTPRDEEGGGG